MMLNAESHFRFSISFRIIFLLPVKSEVMIENSESEQWILAENITSGFKVHFRL